MFTDVLWQDSVRATANSRRDGVVSLEVWMSFDVVVGYNSSFSHLFYSTIIHHRKQRQWRMIPMMK